MAKRYMHHATTFTIHNGLVYIGCVCGIIVSGVEEPVTDNLSWAELWTKHVLED